ncbi:MAG: hypothetical protein AB8B97_11760 [Granulosicoccus sp.]
MNNPVVLNDSAAPAVIAVIGCDGSGKSTLSRWLAEELGQRKQAQFIYFGTGDGPGTPIIRVLNWLKQRSRFNLKKPVAAAPLSGEPTTVVEKHAVITAADSGRQKNKPPTILRLVWAAAALSDRHAKMRQLKRCVSDGKFVVTDRYPQAEFWGVHDGPRLGYLLESGSRGLSYTIAKWEQSAYYRMVQRKPDLVILLDVSVEVAHARRPEEPVDELTRRIKVAQSLRFQGAVRVVLDASEALEIVQQKALQAALACHRSGQDSDGEKMHVKAGMEN